MGKNKTILIIVIAVAVIIFGIFILTSKKEAPAVENTDNQAEETIGQSEDMSSTTIDMASSTTSTVVTGTPKTTTTKPATKTTVTEPGAATLTYTNALKIYSASGYRFQIINGRASPGSMIIKKGKTFMLDNRDGKAHTVKVGTASYRIAAYGFVIATAKSLGTNYIMVDGISSAKIEVE